MRMIAAPAALLLAVLPAEALACTLVGESAIPSAQHDRNLRAGWQHADAVVETVVQIGSARRAGRPGIMRVLHVYKGNIQAGGWLPVFASNPVLCGTGDFRVGQRGVLVIRSLRSPIHFYGFLPPGDLARLHRFGLMPAR